MECTKKAHLIQSWHLFLVTIIFLGIGYFSDNNQGESQLFFQNKIYLAFYCIYVIPALLLHFYYWFLNRNVGIDKAERIIFIKDEKNESLRSYLLEDISKVEVTYSFANANNTFRVLGSDSYLFADVYFGGDQKVTVTSIIDEELIYIRNLYPEKTTYKECLFCIPNF